MSGLRSHPNPKLPKLRLPKDLPRGSVLYHVMRALLHMAITLMWKARVFNRHHEPAAGSVLYICNHQSYLDPILATYMLQRPGNYMARHTLFRNRVFGAFIKAVNAFPVRRGAADIAAVKEAMRRLKAGGCVVVFAEGTRTRDGHIRRMLPGVVLLAQRTANWTVPVVVDGAFECWPKGKALPRPGKIVVQYGTPIAQADARKMKPADLLARIRQEMIAIQATLRRRLGRPALTYSEDPAH